MSGIFAAEIFGHSLPVPSIGVVVVFFVVGFFLLSRNGGGAEGGVHPGKAGRGRMHRCQRCGRDFQPEQIELLGNGEIRQWIDDRCPNCGWDVDWGSPKKPGGSSGTW